MSTAMSFLFLVTLIGCIAGYEWLRSERGR
jgi:hypothetical protein